MSNQLAVKEYMHQDAIVKGFADVLGNSREANAYISSVLIAVANSNALQDCTPISIVSSAMRAATLRLSCDPGVGKAYLVPFKNNATLVIGYKGLIDLALRTGQYRYLNVSPIYEGEIIAEDRLTGIHTIADGGKKSNTVIGYLAYLKMVSGFEKTIYMTIEEIAAHAQRYSKNYTSDRSIWKTHAREMEKKTVLRQLLTKWGYFDPHDSMMISKLEEADEIIEGEIIEPPAEKPAEPPPSAAQINAELGYDQLMPPELAERYEQPAAEPAPAPINNRVARPYPPEILRKELLARAAPHAKKAVSDKQIQLAAQLLGLAFVGEHEADKMRHTVQEYLFGKPSLKDAPAGAVIAMLNDWLMPKADSGGAYSIDATAEKEIRAVYAEALRLQGQMELL